jgi:Secretion system C-terminal sorting domain/Beta-propeller repeat
MKRVFFLLSLFVVSLQSSAKTFHKGEDNNLVFIENKGQLRDQYGHPRPDIQYYVHSNGVTAYIGNGQVHYQFCRQLQGNSNHDAQSRFATYRMDVDLENSTGYAQIQTAGKERFKEHYYTRGISASGAHSEAYKQVTYKNVYPGIDWVFSITDNKLEYSFVAGPNADLSMIKLKYKGQQALTLGDDGSITATTPLGVIKEHAPYCYYETENGRNVVPSSFRLHNNLLSFNVGGDPSVAVLRKPLTIDPVLEWGTYYGPDSNTSYFYDVACDHAANLYACGLTYGTVGIATTGSYQDTLNGSTDSYIVKFDSSGHRVWATYYGGENNDWGSAITVDNIGNIYVCGSTASDSDMATPGCAQSFNGGGLWCGFVAKFDTSGSRIWGTFLGGSTGATFDLEMGSISCDSFGHVYVSGTCDDTSNVATPGTFRPVKPEGMDTAIDCFLVQYDTTGNKLWGTYYGGPGRNQTYVGANCNDGTNVYLGCYTNDTDAGYITTSACYQPTMRGSSDALLVKFNQAGSRIWATYYGGESSESLTGLAFNPGAGLYVFGITYSDSDMASTGCYDSVNAGNGDAYVALFSPELGMRIWGTYFGGPGQESSNYSRITCDDSGNVFVDGYTASASGIASSGAWQSTLGGGDYDAFLAKYNTSGVLQWSTYYGGDGDDQPYACASDGKNVYLCGSTNSTNQIATSGSFLSTSLGGTYFYQGFLSKFNNLPLASLSVKGIPDMEVSLYPSPNNGSFIVSGADGTSSGLSVTITDILGRVIYFQPIQSNGNRFSQTVRLTEAAGVYFCTINSTSGSKTIKFVIN